ncbi:hypothetical protein GCM10010381_58160 [Streptomyces xantholiticus]|nr:hypothetical protein GCM10010381_58160 [Streptomyces xantholiticus]
MSNALPSRRVREELGAASGAKVALGARSAATEAGSRFSKNAVMNAWAASRVSWCTLLVINYD